MKAFLALFAVVAGAVAMPIATKYAVVEDGECVSAPGYDVGVYSSAGVLGSPTGLLTANGTASCTYPFGSDVAVGCATGYASTSPSGVFSGNNLTDLPSTWTENYDAETTSFTCALTGCAYTCTTDGNATDGCASDSGAIEAGSTVGSVCNTGYYATSGYECPAGGSSNATAVVCSNDVNNCPASDYVACAAAIGGGYSVPATCFCEEGFEPSCPTTNENSPGCLPCEIACQDAARQNLRASAAICPRSVDTIAEATDCFEQAACAGAINGGVDTCVYGRTAVCHTDTCPKCPSSSKKSLLGLLGLLGLIPLLLLSLLCCCLLCCIRRRKVERDVHFATFDAGAPTVAAPMASFQQASFAPACATPIGTHGMY